jgi:PTS system ascorbate-specific IIA component
MLLRQLYELNRFNLVDGPLEWREALREGVKPLIADGSVEPEYADCLIQNVEKHGPYIVLLPGLAMPHAMEGAVGTNRSAISFMRVKEPVHFGAEDDPDTSAQVFFTLSDVDAESHLQNMQRLAVVMSNEEVIEKLKAIESPEELFEIDALAGDE